MATKAQTPATMPAAWQPWDWHQLPEPLTGAVQTIEQEVQARWGLQAAVVAARPAAEPGPEDRWTKLQHRFEWAELPEVVLAHLSQVETAIRGAGEPPTVLLGVRPRRR